VADEKHPSLARRRPDHARKLKLLVSVVVPSIYPVSRVSGFHTRYVAYNSTFVLRHYGIWDGIFALWYCMVYGMMSHDAFDMPGQPTEGSKRIKLTFPNWWHFSMYIRCQFEYLTRCTKIRVFLHMAYYVNLQNDKLIQGISKGYSAYVGTRI